MKNQFIILALFFIISVTFGQQQRKFYQLKEYLVKTEYQVKIMDEYLETAFLPALHKIGIQNIGVFKPIENEVDTLTTIYVFIPFSSLDQFAELETKLAKDKQYEKDGSAYINAANDNPPYLRIESTLLKAFEGMPEPRIPPFTNAKRERVYELRSYESPTEKFYANKVDMFNAGGELVLFDELEFNAVFYAEVISGSTMPNLMYMTSFTDMESRVSHWKTFGNSPGWNAIKSKPEYKVKNMNKAVIKLLYPTDYSDY